MAGGTRFPCVEWTSHEPESVPRLAGRTRADDPTPAQEKPARTFAVGERWAYRESDLLTKNETGRLADLVSAADAAEYWLDSQRAAHSSAMNFCAPPSGHRPSDS